MTKERLLAFAKAWADKNVEDTIHFFTKDCVYRPSVFDKDRKEFLGKQEVQKAIEEMMAHDNTISSNVSNIRIEGDFGFWEWEYITEDHNSISGCDVFKFREDSIVEKNAFRRIKISYDKK